MNFAYTIFDDIRDNGSAWSSHACVRIRARNAKIASRRIRKIARTEGRTCGKYRPDNSLHFIVWAENGRIVASENVPLGGSGLPKGNWIKTED